MITTMGAAIPSGCKNYTQQPGWPIRDPARRSTGPLRSGGLPIPELHGKQFGNCTRGPHRSVRKVGKHSPLKTKQNNNNKNSGSWLKGTLSRGDFGPRCRRSGWSQGAVTSLGCLERCGRLASEFHPPPPRPFRNCQLSHHVNISRLPKAARRRSFGNIQIRSTSLSLCAT